MSTTNETHHRLGYSVTEASIKVGCCRDNIYNAIREGRLEARKLGRRTIITSEALDRFLADLPPLKLAPASKEAALPRNAKGALFAQRAPRNCLPSPTTTSTTAL
jgi:excisionase family DNA binding protein